MTLRISCYMSRLTW